MMGVRVYTPLFSNLPISDISMTTASSNNTVDLKDALRLGMRRLASGVCVVSASANGQSYAMTASSVTSVSDDPASLLVCVNQEAALQPVLVKGQSFVINVLSQKQQQISNHCASKDTADKRFSIGEWQSDENNQPFLTDALVSFFCSVDNDNYLYGTHQIVIGRIEKVVVSDQGIDPLVYVNGSYAAIV